jgi:capsular polysaccharide biosynthesis protein
MKSLVAILERHRITLLLAAIGGALLGAIAGLLRPPSYQATAKLVIVPVDDPTATGGVTAGYDLATVTLPVVMAILHSSSLGERAVERLDLAHAWNLGAAQASARVTAGVMVGSERKTNLITLSYIDRSPERARDVAAALAELATTMSTELWSARNRQHRQTLERDLAEIDSRLAAAETALQDFRERNHVVDLPEQIRATVEEGAALERLRIGKSIDVRIAGGFGGPESVEVRKGSLERNAAEKALKAADAARRPAPRQRGATVARGRGVGGAVRRALRLAARVASGDSAAASIDGDSLCGLAHSRFSRSWRRCV